MKLGPEKGNKSYQRNDAKFSAESEKSEKDKCMCYQGDQGWHRHPFCSFPSAKSSHKMTSGMTSLGVGLCSATCYVTVADLIELQMYG